MAFSAPDFQFSIPSVSPFIWPDSSLACFDRAGGFGISLRGNGALKREIHYILFRSSGGRQRQAKAEQKIKCNIQRPNQKRSAPCSESVVCVCAKCVICAK